MSEDRIVIPDWKSVLGKSYSVWVMWLMIGVFVIPDLIFYTTGRDLNPAVVTIIGLMLCLAGLVGRLLAQSERHKWKRRAIIAAMVIVTALMAGPALADDCQPDRFDEVAFDLISKWEGKENQAYQDIVGVWTICYGHTRTVIPGETRTDEQCRDLLIEEIAEYREGLHQYFTPQTRLSRLPAERDAAYTSLAYNVGIRGAGRSTATRRLNKGNIAGGCAALRWWNRAGGRVVRGLVNRRSAEYDLCMIGLR